MFVDERIIRVQAVRATISYLFFFSKRVSLILSEDLLWHVSLQRFSLFLQIPIVASGIEYSIVAHRKARGHQMGTICNGHNALQEAVKIEIVNFQSNHPMKHTTTVFFSRHQFKSL